MSPQQKQWIDGASYADLIARVQNEPPASPWFQGDTGEYIFSALRLKIAHLIQQEKVAFKYLTSSSASGVEQIYVTRTA